MFTVRNQQLALLEQSARRAFENRITDVIATDYPTGYERLGAAGTRRLIASAIDLGQKHGIVTEGGVGSLAGLMVQYGRSFENSPDRHWALDVLAHPTLPGPIKIELLLERMAGRALGRVVVAQDGD